MDASSLHPSGMGMGATPLSAGASSPTETPAPPQLMLLDFFFPGFSVFSAAVQKSLHIDLTIYIPLVLLLGVITFAWRYFSEQIWELTEKYLMSVVDIRTDDEIYNMLMAWVAAQRFAQGARRFVVNTNLNSRSWFLWRYDYDDDEDDEIGEEDGMTISKKDKKALAYTPTFGSHWFWYKGRLLIFHRIQNREQSSFLTASEREEISIYCFGRDPWVLKELLHEARQAYMKRDEHKTLIYRGTTSRNTSEPTWQRCMARTSRPFSTVILNEKVKKDLIDDVTDYLNPATRRWYANRGIPYRRGYLLYGPPGTGKSSLSLALAGFFKMRIYIVSLSSPAANEENLASLFADLPRRCVVLLEDIDTAGLTHTREDGKNTSDDSSQDDGSMVPGQKTAGNQNNSGRLSLSGLLNILDGVASQEGRVLIMTTNHIEKLDKALIRPGRVDMIVKFDRADRGMTAEIFKAIFAPLEGDDVPSDHTTSIGKPLILDAKTEKELAAKKAAADKAKEETIKRVSKLAEEFAAKIPEREFSPAEIQGYLLKNKRNPEGAVEGAEQWVVDTRREKEEKAAKDAEEKKKKEEEEKKKEEEEKKKQEEERKKQEEKKQKEKEEKKNKKNKKSKQKGKNNNDETSSSSSSSSESETESDAESESDSEDEKRKKRRKGKKSSKKVSKSSTPKSKAKDNGESKAKANGQQRPDTPPPTPKKNGFEEGSPEQLIVKAEAPTEADVEKGQSASNSLQAAGVKVTGEEHDSGYVTPSTSSVEGHGETDAVMTMAPAPSPIKV